MVIFYWFYFIPPGLGLYDFVPGPFSGDLMAYYFIPPGLRPLLGFILRVYTWDLYLLYFWFIVSYPGLGLYDFVPGPFSGDLMAYYSLSRPVALTPRFFNPPESPICGFICGFIILFLFPIPLPFVLLSLVLFITFFTCLMFYLSFPYSSCACVFRLYVLAKTRRVCSW
jgi:hypothetical protein